MKRYFLFLLLVACSEKKSDTVLTPGEFDTKYKSTKNAILLDVRTLDQVATGKIANTENIVWDASFADNLSNLENKPLFIYCGSGTRSARAAAVLKEKGYKEVYELDGGIKAWKAAGMPVE